MVTKVIVVGNVGVAGSSPAKSTKQSLRVSETEYHASLISFAILGPTPRPATNLIGLNVPSSFYVLTLTKTYMHP